MPKAGLNTKNCLILVFNLIYLKKGGSANVRNRVVLNKRYYFFFYPPEGDHPLGDPLWGPNLISFCLICRPLENIFWTSILRW